MLKFNNNCHSYSMRCKWLGRVFCKVLCLQSAYYLWFVVCSLSSVLPRPAVCSLWFIDRRNAATSFKKLRAMSVLDCPRNPFEENIASTKPAKFHKQQKYPVSFFYTACTFKMSAKLKVTWIPHAFPNQVLTTNTNCCNFCSNLYQIIFCKVVQNFPRSPSENVPYYTLTICNFSPPTQD